MKILRSLPAKKPVPRLVLAIGVFDGLHRGHLAVLKRLLARARALKATPALLTFDAMPETVIAPGYAPPSLTSLSHRLELIEAAGVKLALVPRFDRRFAAIEAEQFASRLARLGALEIVVGADFNFGARAEGDAATLRAAGLKVIEVAPASAGGRPVSSTRIRHLIGDGDLKGAAKLLGRPFTLRGRVKRGAGLGRKLGYPTANLDPEQGARPAPGVWGGRARLLPKGPWVPMIANLGFRPTLKGKTFLIELHWLDWKGNLYGKRVEAELMLPLRPERRFESLEALKRQIRLDEVRFRRSRAFHSALRRSDALLG